jgi:biotin-(acetyl-CoA carboxylase) ligase
MRIKIVLEKGEDGFIVAKAPSLPGCFSQGKTEKIIRAYQSKFIIPIGKVINIQQENENHSGRFLGIDPQGRLRIRQSGREHLFSPAEIQSVQIASLKP